MLIPPPRQPATAAKKTTAKTLKKAAKKAAKSAATKPAKNAAETTAEKTVENIPETTAEKILEKIPEERYDPTCPHYIQKWVAWNYFNREGPLLYEDNITMRVIRKIALFERGELFTPEAEALQAEITRRKLAPGSNEVMKLGLETEMAKVRAVRALRAGRDMVTALPVWLRTPEMIETMQWAADRPDLFIDEVEAKEKAEEQAEEETEEQTEGHTEGHTEGKCIDCGDCL